jgi:predicted aminopeptidase
MKRFQKFLGLLALLLSTSGCANLLYLSKLGWHQSFVTFRSVPVQEVLGDAQVDDLTKGKIRLIQEVKHYGEERFGLRKTKNYSKVFEMKGAVLHVITACEKDRLHLYSWDFPIVGKVTYKSFFRADEALKEKGPGLQHARVAERSHFLFHAGMERRPPGPGHSS